MSSPAHVSFCGVLPALESALCPDLMTSFPGVFSPPQPSNQAEVRWGEGLGPRFLAPSRGFALGPARDAVEGLEARWPGACCREMSTSRCLMGGLDSDAHEPHPAVERAACREGPWRRGLPAALATSSAFSQEEQHHRGRRREHHQLGPVADLRGAGKRGDLVWALWGCLPQTRKRKTGICVKGRDAP